ncbi:MAG: Zn-ribbon domain-containing OB-fold protein [Shewanella algae]
MESIREPDPAPSLKDKPKDKLKAARQIAINPELFDWPSDSPALKASQCQHCGTLAFPQSKSCMACGSEEVAVRELPASGSLWTYTVQRFMPKSPYNSDETPKTYRPYGIGYVELGGAIRVETRIPLEEGAELALDTPMALGFYVHRTEDDGTQVMNYHFTPVVAESGQTESAA